MLTSDRFLVAWTVFYVIVLLCYTTARTYGSDLFGGGNYGFNDFFINYEGGFIRRGLLGQLLHYSWQAGFNPIIVAFCLSFASYIVIAVYMIRQFVKRGYNVCLLTVSYMLGAIGMYSLPSMRRDYMIMCAFLLVVLLWRKMKPLWWVAVANVIVSITILCYEPFAFFAVPFGILLANVRFRNWYKSIGYWIPSMLIFLLCCKYPGNEDTFLGIWGAVRNYLSSPGIIDFIMCGVSDAIMFHLSNNFLNCSAFVPIELITIPSLFFVLYYCCNAVPVYSPQWMALTERRYLLALLLAGMLFLSPMFTVLSTDYGRTAMYVALSAFIIYFNLSETELLQLMPTWAYKASDRILAFVDKYFPPSRMKIVCIMLFTGILYCTNGGIMSAIHHTEVGTVIYSFFLAFKELFHIIS